MRAWTDAPTHLLGFLPFVATHVATLTCMVRGVGLVQSFSWDSCRLDLQVLQPAEKAQSGLASYMQIENSYAGDRSILVVVYKLTGNDVVVTRKTNGIMGTCRRRSRRGTCRPGRAPCRPRCAPRPSPAARSSAWPRPPTCRPRRRARCCATGPACPCRTPPAPARTACSASPSTAPSSSSATSLPSLSSVSAWLGFVSECWGQEGSLARSWLLQLAMGLCFWFAFWEENREMQRYL